MNTAQRAARRLAEANAVGYYCDGNGLVYRLRAVAAADLAGQGLVHLPGVGEAHDALRQIRADLQIGSTDSGAQRIQRSAAAMATLQKEMQDPAKALAFTEDLSCWFAASCDGIGEVPAGTAVAPYSRLAVLPTGCDIGSVRFVRDLDLEDPDAEVPVLGVARIDAGDMARMALLAISLGGLVEQLKPFRQTA